MLSFLFRCIGCKGCLQDFSAFPLCPGCDQSLLECPKLCDFCGSPVCLQQPLQECTRPWTEPNLIQSYTAQYLLLGRSYKILKRWKTHRGLLFDRRVLKLNSHALQHISQLRAQAIVPVPQDFRRSWQLRGSPSLRLAEWIGSQVHAPLLHLLLPQAKQTRGKRQAQLSLRERLANPIRFSVNQDLLAAREVPSRVILVDDFLTTGHTARRAAQALRDMGVKQCHLFCLGVRPALILR